MSDLQEKYFASFYSERIVNGEVEAYSGEAVFTATVRDFSLLPRKEQLEIVGNSILDDLQFGVDDQATITITAFELMRVQ